LFKDALLGHHDQIEFVLEMKLVAIVEDLKVSLEKIPQLLGIIKVCKLFEKS
jgi:hypothetical protein